MEEFGVKEDNQPNVAEAGTSIIEEVPRIAPEASPQSSKQRQRSSRETSASRHLRRRQSNRLTLLSIEERQDESCALERVHLAAHLQWDIHDPVSNRDWIALYILDETDSSKSLASLGAGVLGSQSGDTMWLLDLPQTARALTQQECAKLLCFRYYSGLNLSCLAQSEPLSLPQQQPQQVSERQVPQVPTPQVVQPQLQRHGRCKASERLGSSHTPGK